MVLMVWSPMQLANAGMIGTDQAASVASQADRNTVLQFLGRADVTSQLQSLGVDPAAVKDRVAAMTDQEVQSLAGKIHSMPAGADSTGTILLLIVIGVRGVVDLVPPLAIRFVPQSARAIAGVFILAAAAGCASLVPQTKELAERGVPPGLPERIELTAVPFFPQLEYQCGPAALATVLVGAGAKTTPEELVPQVYIPERKGSLQVEMLAAARRHGMVSYALAPRFEDLLREIAAGTPVIVLQNLGLFSAGWHYAVAIGYDYPRGTLVLRSGTQEREVMPFAAHEVVWMRSGYWAMVAVPPDRIPVTAEEKLAQRHRRARAHR